MDVIFREYVRIAWQKKFYFFLVLLALGSATVLDIYVPTYYKAIANGLAQPYTATVFESLMDALLSISACYIGIWLSWRFLEIGIIPLDGGGVALLEKRCFEVLAQQRYSFFENNFSGSLIKKAHRFSSSFEVIMDWFLFHFYQNVLAVMVSFVIFYQQQKQFAYYFLIWVLVFISWSIAFSIWKLRYDKEVAKWDSRLGGVYSDAISNIFLVKSFALESTEQNQVNRTVETTYKKKKTAWILMFISFAVQGILTFGIELLLFYLMIEKWKVGEFQVGEFVLFQSILLMLIQRLWEFGRNFRTFFTAVADAAEMADVFRNNDIERNSASAGAAEVTAGEIEFENINFQYADQYNPENLLFSNFSLHIQAREKVALVGISGSGKTTLTKLLFRFCEPRSGSIRIDGVDTRNFTLESLRRQISLVPQHPELFHRSIRDNIALDRPVDAQQLEDIVEKSHCREFIESLPDQLETVVGERGVKLSGGEKQRIAIARAFLENAPILVLDEATSALDSVTEKRIQSAMFELMEDKTAIVIAHRLSTILRMDRILVLEDGQIAEQGTHQQLLRKKGKYHEMWQHQSGGFLTVS